MKSATIFSILICLLFSLNSYSQNIENKKKETTERKVTVKDTNVETVIETEVDEEVKVLEVEGTTMTNQQSEEKTKKDQKVKVVEVNKSNNEENQKQIDVIKKEEVKRIDGQQRGVPIQTKKDTSSVVMQKEKVQKEGGK